MIQIRACSRDAKGRRGKDFIRNVRFDRAELFLLLFQQGLKWAWGNLAL